ncbi:MAG: ABC transporter ATP-binding protein [Clostridiales bacterium]|jgi:ABC-2 type transport system ATP-binding protein|uniref:ABC transporter ATP-binding protein n=1 Tax=Chordicoccus furentiruminis TaxID=2709410 RepID=UPI0023A7960A|nr:ABC transporter ATP-binding protein [Chordicoccus furentiruminis]MCI6173643.1 ABC transporter ATP-binding protein [Clostridiales bacterium]
MLETKSVSKYYLNKPVLKDASVRIEPGNIYALLGPNGSGKTTWMKIAATLAKPTEGEVLLDGKPADTESRKKIAYLPTDPFFYNWMTAEDVGRYYQDFFDDFSEEKYREMLGQMELTENLRVKNLSSGMTAKLKIAVTMARNAEIYLLDEPLNGIDLLARDRIMEAIIRSSGPDVAMIISSHLVEEIESFVNRVIFVRQGRIVEQADTEELRQTRNVSLTDRYRALMAGVSEQ